MLDATYGPVRNSGLFGMLLDFGAIKKNGTRYELPGVIEGSFFKKDFAKLFSEHEEEYIDKLQVIMDNIEEEIKNKRLNINVSDMSEYNDEENIGENNLVEEDETSSREVLTAMQSELEG